MNPNSTVSFVGRPWRALCLGGVVAAAALLGGCAGLQSVQSDVSSYGTWTTAQSPGSFVIERLPSQQQQPDPELEKLEQAASAALQRAGFQPASPGALAAYSVQIGATVSRLDRSPWDDPLWLNAWGTRWRTLAWYQPDWAWQIRHDRSEYLHEVAVLIRDRASNEPVYETRARSNGINRGGVEVLGAMFSAAMKDFPAVQPEPHPVIVGLR